MSTNAKRWTSEEAAIVATELLERLESQCTRIVIAGSLRRQKPNVGDVEILFIPRMGERQKDMFTTEPFSLADQKIDNLLAMDILRKRPSAIGSFTWGEKNKLAVHVVSGIPVDLFATTEENWWVSLVVRTGSKETNLRLTTGAQRAGKSLQAYGCGVTNADGTVTPATSEQDVFRLCGVKYLEPWER